ncbi:MAG: hypothetical protein JNM88_01385 [Chitinophagaceae bacterium]|nr:hypothetical protein [Chitinophagaceae bacterium]
MAAPPVPDGGKAEKFFNRHAADDPLVKSILLKMQRENNQHPFIENIIAKVGYPHWDKAIVMQKVNKTGRVSTDDSSIVYIPFVRDSQNYVNSLLLFKLSPEDTSYQYLSDWQYAEFGFDSTGTGWNAKDVFHLFANFDRAVFGRTNFLITDGRIFGRQENEQTLIKLRPTASQGRNNILVYTTVCDLVDHCWAPEGTVPCQECTTGCSQYIYTTIECTTGWVDDGWTTGGGGTGSGGTGGGSTGGGGGYPPPECGGVAPLTEVDPNCGPGWVPPGGPVFPPAEPIDSMLGRYYSRIKTRVDSLLTKSLLLNWEHSMILVKKGDSIYLKNEKTSQDSLSTEVNFSLGAGEILLGYIHCHSSASSNVNDRSAPSGSDVKALLLYLSKNFTQMTECGNAAYAMVVEDSARAKKFLDSLSRHDLDARIRDSALTIPGWFSNWQNATQVALKNVLGQSTKSGIGLYKTTDPMRKSWIKLN